MAKVIYALLLFLFLTNHTAFAQAYPLTYRSSDADSTTMAQLNLQSAFTSRAEATEYIGKIVTLLNSRGYMAASVDSVLLDSTSGNLLLYLGKPYTFDRIRTDAKDAELLNAIRWPSGAIAAGKLSFLQQKILDQLEQEGYPFGKSYLENVQFSGEAITADLKIERGGVYHIDSIRVYGDVNIKNEFLQQYLQIQNHSPYNRHKLQQVSKRITELGFITEDRPADLTMLGTGAVLNLYLRQKQTSRINALVGFLPSTDIYLKRKLLLAVDANVLLKNAFGNAETIGLLWQQLQQQSPRLNLTYDQPYIFLSPVGLQFAFDMFKQDTSFLNLNLKLGGSYYLANNRTASIFLLARQSIVNGINEAQVIQSRKLPLEADVQSVDLGAGYSYNNTDYRLNPKTGWDFDITTSAGTKNIRRNNLILGLKDPYDPNFSFATLYDTVKSSAYQFRVAGVLSKFFPVGKQSTLKLSTNGGWYQSASYFRNEMFRIGGYRLLRGFNDESQYVSQYLLGTIEYRYLIGLNSAFFVFADGGAGKHAMEEKKYHQYISSGLGLSFETKAGVLQMAWAVGKRDDTELNFRQSKIHIGFASYF